MGYFPLMQIAEVNHACFLGSVARIKSRLQVTTEDRRIVVHIEIDIHVAFDKELLE